MRFAQEGAEDSLEAAAVDLAQLNLDPELDSLIGIAASGRTPYVLGCLEYAKRKVGCVTIGVACSTPSGMSKSGVVDYMIEAVTGPEVVTGSTRMKAGTATKLVLNMLSTGVMIKVGKTYGNMVRFMLSFMSRRAARLTNSLQMVDLKTSNLKLQQRSRNIIRKLGGPSCPPTDTEIDALLANCNGSVKLVLATLGLESTVDEARKRLDEAGGSLSTVLESKKKELTKSKQDDEMVLYIDGGGTKCAAVIMGQNSNIGEAEAGPCNVYVSPVSPAPCTQLTIPQGWTSTWTLHSLLLSSQPSVLLIHSSPPPRPRLTFDPPNSRLSGSVSRATTAQK